MSAAAIRATFADFRLVKTRKLAQFVFELPIEQADHALEVLGGLPRSDAERWVGIARLNGSAEAPPEKPRKAWADLPPATQAAIRCGEPEFQNHLGVADAESAADRVRNICGVASRSELNTYQKARVIWHQLDTEFLQATGRLAHG